MKREWMIDACSGKCIDVTEEQRITVVDLEGGQVVDFFAVSAKDTSEFLSTGVTIDCNESLRLHVGDLVYSNLYRPMFQILSDDVGEHDLLHPCCRKEMYDFFYQNGNGHPNCLDNINRALNERRTIVHPLNLFMHTKINGDGSITVARPLSKPGDTIVLKARMNLRLGVAACSVSESDCNGGKCTPVKIIVED
ncbi:urea carboxylase-associated family protein [Candidatus Borkfalkia ceftriaxoniphila]|uniref:Urea carboxylase-associated family protein n=1 Tax=Candidatus Borkfalkia ceftriaxoniphila TaxID=2508949 RepID=A0A4Q2KAK5_9FIRM|nr:urea carboxylase-associated family protein [Candidatus Borkfalkia ceftriaxoniphila]RXZ61029.1 urea carboxylase-associated family protein [Candidatus Borkfalkia ceftriaxoniphila]